MFSFILSYAIISWFLISNVTPYEEIAVLSFTTAGALICVSYGPHTENRDISGVGTLVSQSNNLFVIEKQTKNRNETGSDLTLGELLMSVKTSKPQAFL